MRLFYFLFCVVATVAPGGMAAYKNAEREMTVEIGAGKEDCFYETLKSGETLDVEYQVIDGGQRNELEIDFRIFNPSGVPIVADFRKSDNAHRSTVDADGDYKICFDNSMSRFSPKIVFFEIIIENEDDANYDEFGDISFSEDVAVENYDVQVTDIEEALKSIKERISRSRHFQDQLRAVEYRDRSMAEHNFENVNFWSVCHMTIMIIAGLCQVILVRSLFDEKSSIHGIWKRFL